MDEGYEVYCGLDVGKSEHHAAALNAARERVFDKPLPQDEARLRELFTNLQQHGRVLVIVDQPNTIGALPVAVARDCGCTVAYLPGLSMRKAAHLYPGKSKTDACDAFIIAETARAMPHTLRAVDRDSEVLAALKVLSELDADLTHECTRAINRLPAAADFPRAGTCLPRNRADPVAGFGAVHQVLRAHRVAGRRAVQRAALGQKPLRPKHAPKNGYGSMENRSGACAYRLAAALIPADGRDGKFNF
jgi:hypothetical protein